ncbi:MAG: radical SAM protein [Clostridiales bacterium]|nr:radical SAM protein [Clostridiales bacterium]
MAQLTVFAKGFNYSEDGPGNRLVLHLQGCNLGCPWCANPEGMPASPPPGWRAESRTVEDWFAFVRSSAPLFFSGGGLTLTGGEVGMQLDAAAALLRRCRAAGIHTAIETNLSLPRMPELFDGLSLLIADYKHPDADALRRGCGADLAQVERNFALALGAGLPVIARVTLIGGFNADAAWADAFAGALARIAAWGRPGQLSVELLTYHEYGKEKWARCGRAYTVADGFVRPAAVEAFRRTLAEAGLPRVAT